MEVCITHLMADPHSMVEYSASVAEQGGNVGAYTWGNAMETAGELPLVTSEDGLQELRNWFSEFGAWDSEEIASWSADELNALLLQMIAGDIRERQHYADQDELDDYEERLGGRICSDGSGEWYYYVGC